jgi:phosphatidylglycerophosphate synthase
VTTQDRFDADLLGFELTAGGGVQVGLLTLLWVSVRLHPVGWLVGTAYAMASLAVLTVAVRRSTIRSLGPANRITLARAILVGGVTALVADNLGKHPPVTVIVVLAAVALVLDFVDGLVARRTGSTTALGARFDMEVDAFLILVLSVFVSLSLGLWVLAIGVMRYAFVGAGWLMPWLRSSLPTSFARKTVAATQGIVLVAAATGVFPHVVAITLVALALASLVWSFGRDVVWLWKARTETGQQT